jgi:hypothetical protein
MPAGPAPSKEIEVELKDIGCPYPAEDPRTGIWLAGFSKGHSAGMDAGAKVVSEVYDKSIAETIAGIRS